MSTLFKGAIFDLDGVITGTAKVHSLAWESMFNTFLRQYAEENSEPFVPFDPLHDYHRYVDGKPRMEGVKSFLESRDIELPFGELDDTSEKETVCGLGNRKNIVFTDILKKEGPEVYHTSVELIESLIKNGIRIGIASSSRNCKLILELADLEHLFETRVDGEVSIELGLKGKPNPDIFVTAAANLGLEPHECVVVEDAISGVQAGSRGNFGMVLGIARDIEGSKLREQGADIVVRDLGEITIEGIREWFTEGLRREGWNLTYTEFQPKEEKLRETLTAIGNGYLGVRGAWEGSKAGESHYPGTYIAGVFNRVPSKVHGQTVFNNDFVNAPNWLPVEYRIGGGAFEDPMEQKILSYRHNLDFRGAVMERELVVEDSLGRISRITSVRLASMADPHLLALRFVLRPVNYSDTVEFRTSIDGTVENRGVARYSELATDHLEEVAGSSENGEMLLHVRTSVSKYDIVTLARTRVLSHGREQETARTPLKERRMVGETFALELTPDRSATLEKVVAIHTSLDAQGGEGPVEAARASLRKAGSFDELQEAHRAAWAAIWERADMELEGDRFSQKVLRLHIYHMMGTASPHNPSIDAGMPARGLNGESYRGHIFWDEIFILPFFNSHFPEISRALLMYRYRRLAPAREYARENGYSGAMFPWQTADDGLEDTQILHFNPASGTWGPDLSRKQRHVSIAVFYNTWRYIHDSGDTAFLNAEGAELMLEVARFWASISHCSAETGKYHIEDVMGPDEFHEELPGSGREGLKDNAYTNIMTAWLLEKAVGVTEKMEGQALSALMEKMQLGFDEIELWRTISRSMTIPVDENGIIEQFEGYMGLRELDWAHYRQKYPNIHRMDRILKAEGDSPDNYKVAKQPDVLMTFYALPPSEVARIIEQNGYGHIEPSVLVRENYDYYEPRTSHGSTLSKVVHCIISGYLEGGDETAWNWFSEALKSDIQDTQGGTTQEGIHCGVMAGTLDTVTRFFAGVSFDGDRLSVKPNMPKRWKRLSMKVAFRGSLYRIEIEGAKTTLTLLESPEGKAEAVLNGRELSLTEGKPCTEG